MAKSERQVQLPVGPHHAYCLVRDSGAQIPKFRPGMENPAQCTLRWQRGWGLTNPIDVVARIHSQDGQQCTVHYQASILALADPFGFTDKSLEQFITHLQNTLHAQQTGTPVPLPPTEERSIWVNVAIIGCVVVVLAVIVLVGIVAALMR